MELLRTENLTKIYGDGFKALDDLSFSIHAGEWVAVMGPSGSGKTTLLNLLGGLDKPTSGRVLFEGKDLSSLSKSELTEFRRDNVGFIFQQFHLIPYLTALENVMLAQYYHSMADEAEAMEALAKVGLSDKANQLPSQLSGGEQQRVCIARALINQPKVILADEPTGSLDEENEDIVLDFFRQLHSEGHTIVLVTHDPKVGSFAQRRLVLEHGHLLDFSTRPLAHSPTRQDSFVARRHRLTERLFFDALRVPLEHVHDTASQFEDGLSMEAVNTLCALLNHPSTCPHGKPIPPGPCCPPKRDRPADARLL